MKNFIKKNSFLLPIIAISNLFLCAPQTVMYSHNAIDQLVDFKKTALCLPLKKINIEYIDNTQLKPAVQYSDSFFINAANGLLIYEASQRLNIIRNKTDTVDSKIEYELPGYSLLVHDTVNMDSNSKVISKIAEENGADLIVIPYSCTIRQYTTREKGWRDNSGPGYEKPVFYNASTIMHVQIWNKKGSLIYERISRSEKGRPVLYSLLKKKKVESDIVLFVKKMYAPPMLKSLYSTIKLAMRFKT